MADPYDALGDLYDEWVVSVVEDLPFYRSLAFDAVPAGDDRPARVLEVGAGSGRVTMPLLARGCEVVALDVAAGQLERLRQLVEVGAAGEDAAPLLHAVHGDVREVGALAGVTRHAPYDLVIAPFRSLLHVASDAAGVFTQVAALLRPGGTLAFDVFHPGEHGGDALAGDWSLRRRVDLGDCGHWAIWERASLQSGGDVLELEVRCDLLAGPGAPKGGARHARMLLQVPPAAHWRAALEAAGLELVATYGWFDGEPLVEGDVDSVWVARRAD